MTKATLAGLVATTLVVGAAVTGCGSHRSVNPSSSASASSTPAAPTSSGAAAQPSDYSNLLIKPTDIVLPGDTFALTQSLPLPNPGGVTALFLNQSASRKVDDSLYVYPDTATARQARDTAVKTLADPDLGVKGAPTQADVGSGGTVAVGSSPDGSKAKAAVMFSEGKVFVDLEFESAPNDPVQPEFVLDVARKQDAAIKAGMPT